MKKLLSVIIALLFVFSITCAVFAEEFEVKKPEIEEYKGGFRAEFKWLDEPPKMRGAAKGGDSSEFLQSLENQLLAHQNPIVLDGWKSYYQNGTLVHKMLGTIVSNYGIMAYADIDGAYIDGKGQLIFSPKYIFDSFEQDEQARALMDAEIAEYLEAASEIPDSDVVGKMLVIHDLFCKNNEYAHEELAAGNDDLIYTAYGLFSTGRAVCQGYSIALKAIYDALNEQLKQNAHTSEDIIETSYCESDNNIHIWNIVKLNGEWYHLDVTWDDPTDPYGDGIKREGAAHTNFLKPYAQMSNHIKDGIVDWVYYTDETPVCDDTKYTQGYIFNRNFYGLISYSNGRYDIDIEIQGDNYTFGSNSIISTDILATDAYDYNYGGRIVKRILLYTDEDVTARQFISVYDENGRLTRLSRLEDINLTARVTSQPYGNKGRLFYWSQNEMKPLCRVIDIQ